MEWIQAIEEIKKAQEKNQLVIFVGSGVSNNSDIPTWGDLIKAIADEIKYDKCVSCKERETDCPKTECKKRYNFSQNEYLRIPEYFYHQDTSERHQKYYELIKNTLKSDKDSNAIDDEIFQILPHHIITTNYDDLLEKSKSLNSKLYTVVSRDSDLLSKSDERYIVKMHGDFKNPETIVLKESDYLDYEQNHTMISTFIRSLLINHSFLFLGYSLNDYNLNLIIGWINYFSKIYGVENRPLNYMISSSMPFEYEKKRLENKNIYVISLESLPDELADNIKIPPSITNPIGKKMYSFLKCISDSRIYQRFIPLSDTLLQKYQVLESYRKISVEDLIRVYSLGRTSFMSTELVFYDKEWYEKVSDIIDSGNEKIIDVFQRAKITEIVSFEENKSKQVPLSSEEQDEAFVLYINNDYISLWDRVGKTGNFDEKLYYYHFFDKKRTEVQSIISEMDPLIGIGDYVAIILHKMRVYLATLSLFNRQVEKGRELEQLFETAPVRYRRAIGYLKSLFESPTKNMVKMDKILKKQEERYERNSKKSFSGHSYIKIWELQRYAYDYYFFFKDNYLPYDYFADVENYLIYYVKAILCSYSPVLSNEGELFETDRRPYLLNEIDLDILIKYVKPKTLKNVLKNYSVQFLEIEKEIDIETKYNNLCKSILEFGVEKWIDELYNFNIVMCMMKLDNTCKQNILNVFSEMYIDISKRNPTMSERLIEPLYYLVKNIAVKGVNSIYTKLLDTLLLKDIYSAIEKTKSRMLSDIIKLLAPSIGDETKRKVIQEIDELTEQDKKINKIYGIRFIFSVEQYREYLTANIRLINTEQLFWFIVEKRVPYNEEIFLRFLETLESENRKRKEHPGVHSYPDQLLMAIDECILLKLLGCDIELDKLKPYKEYSDHLQFMLEPDEFSYSRIDINNYMWQNLIYSPMYQSYFLKHREEILSDDLKKIFDLGVETKEQQKIVYGLLLEDKELQQFPQKI